ncbi:MAG: pirin family protein [bacterium]
MFIDRPAATRGHFNFGWLDTFHSFSFGEYVDPQWMGFRHLRVLNEDRITPEAGFPTHGHRDMEIVTYVLEGALAHRDSLGSEEVLRPGEVQRMTAGTGIRHSEYNGAPGTATHLLQIWVLPEQAGLTPSYEQKEFPLAERRNRWRPVVAPDGREGALRINQDAIFWSALADPGTTLALPQGPERFAWLQVCRGTIRLGERVLVAGDGVGFTQEPDLAVVAESDAELLLIDMG